MSVLWISWVSLPVWSGLAQWGFDGPVWPHSHACYLTHRQLGQRQLGQQMWPGRVPFRLQWACLGFPWQWIEDSPEQLEEGKCLCLSAFQVSTCFTCADWCPIDQPKSNSQASSKCGRRLPILRGEGVICGHFFNHAVPWLVSAMTCLGTSKA